MLSDKFVDKTMLINYVKSEMTKYCQNKEMKIIPVKYGKVGKNAKMSFYSKWPAILVWDKLPSWLLTLEPKNRVWYVDQAIRHELKHYEQYLDAKAKGVKITEAVLDESDAYITGKQYGDRKLSGYTPEEINPASLYRSFHGVNPKNIRKVELDVPPEGSKLVKIGRLISLVYQPEEPSKRKSIHFEHRMGDFGDKKKPSNCILVTDSEGKNFYIVVDKKDKKRPYFSERGIIG